MDEQLIEQAIRENKDLEFNYTKYSGETSRRRVSDISLCNDYEDFGYNNDHIRGFCHIRSEERTFKISRMSSVQILPHTDVSQLKREIRTNPRYSPPPSRSSRNEGCYIATMIYGDYDDPSVLVLRKYRDNKLSKFFWGRILIKIYYFTSPRAVFYLKNQKRINSVIKRTLDGIVSKVKDNTD